MMQQTSLPINTLETIMRGIANYAMTFQTGEWILDEQFIIKLCSLGSDDIQSLSYLLDVNHVTMPFYKAIRKIESNAINRLRENLNSNVLRIMELKRYRDALLKRLAAFFDSMGIDYVVFKTLNKLGSIDVDIDVIIDPSNYDKCVDALLAKGFISIDDLSKRYATGFMINGNPIVIDLHTVLAVLGVRYLSSDFLLRKGHWIEFQPCDNSERFTINILDGAADAMVRMTHSVLKEGVITIEDISEVSHALSSELGLMVRYVDNEDLRLAASVFSYTAFRMLGAEQFEDLITFNDGFTHNLAKNILDNSYQNFILPFKLPIIAYIIVLTDQLKRKRELGRSMPLIVHSLKFNRNAAHLGHMMLERLRM